MKRIVILLSLILMTCQSDADSGILPSLNSIHILDNIQFTSNTSAEDMKKLQYAIVKQLEIEQPYDSLRSKIDSKAEQIEKSITKNFISLVDTYTPFSPQYIITTLSTSYIVFVSKVYTQTFYTNNTPDTRYSLSLGQELISVGIVVTY